MCPGDRATENPVHGNVEGIRSQNAPLSNASFHLKPLTQFTIAPDTAGRLGIQPTKQLDELQWDTNDFQKFEEGNPVDRVKGSLQVYVGSEERLAVLPAGLGQHSECQDPITVERPGVNPLCSRLLLA